MFVHFHLEYPCLSADIKNGHPNRSVKLFFKKLEGAKIKMSNKYQLNNAKELKEEISTIIDDLNKKISKAKSQGFDVSVQQKVIDDGLPTFFVGAGFKMTITI